MTRQDEWTRLLELVYRTPSHAASYSSAEALQREIKKSYRVLIPLTFINDWLNKNYSYTLHRRARVVFPRNTILVTHIDAQWQADLLFMPDLERANKSFSVGLLCIDVMSRYAWGELMPSKHGYVVRDAFEKILNRSAPRKPDQLQTDKGKEFLNASFQKLLKDNGIGFFTSNSDFKAAIVERLIKTVKSKIYKYLDDNNTLKFTDQFQNILQSYNNSYHSSIKMAPSEVNYDTMDVVIRNLYGHILPNGDDHRPSQPPLSVGDYVRVSKIKSKLFRKEYKGNWTEEVFQISHVYHTAPHVTYGIVDLDGEKIEGMYYGYELQQIPSVDLDKDEFKIERVLKTRTRNKVKEMYVKWLGYPDKFNSWVKATSVRSI
jgi:transposase InsO family protein